MNTGNTMGQAFIAHFAYFNAGTGDVSIQLGILSGNFFSPGLQAYAGQPTKFSPGYVDADFKTVPGFTTVTWYLDGNVSTATAFGASGTTGSSPTVTPTPACLLKLLPSTTLSFSGSGTYPQQFLGQVDSGPPAVTAGATYTVTAQSSNPNVTLANLIYVPNDTANPSHSVNPNSLYGDVIIGPRGTAASTTVKVQLLTNGAAILKGLTAMSYTGAYTPPDATATAVTVNPAVIDVTGSAMLSAQVTDKANTDQTPSGSVTFADTIGGVTTTLSTVQLTNGQASLSYTSNSAGAHTLSATYNPDDTTLYAASNGTAAGTVTVLDEHIWVLNANGTLTGLGDNGSIAYSAIGTAQPTATAGGLVIDAGGDVWSATAGASQLNFVNASGTGAQSWTNGGLNDPTSVAIDGAGYIWVSNDTQGLSEFDNRGNALSPSSGLATGIERPLSVAIDSAGSVWVANGRKNTVTEVIGAATPVEAPTASALVNGKLGTEP